jgi:hypothetical protein
VASRLIELEASVTPRYIKGAYLRHYAGVKAGRGGTPAKNFEKLQEKRRGDAAMQWTERDLLTRFVPW